MLSAARHLTRAAGYKILPVPAFTPCLMNSTEEFSLTFHTHFTVVLCWNYSMAPSNPYWRSIHLLPAGFEEALHDLTTCLIETGDQTSECLNHECPLKYHRLTYLFRSHLTNRSTSTWNSTSEVGIIQFYNTLPGGRPCWHGGNEECQVDTGL